MKISSTLISLGFLFYGSFMLRLPSSVYNLIKLSFYFFLLSHCILFRIRRRIIDDIGNII